MKTIFKYSYIIIFAVLAVGLNACTDDYEYDPAPVNNAGAYLSASQTDLYFTPDKEQSFNITVSRHDSVSAQTIKLKTDNSKFTVPDTVKFAAGQKSKVVNIKFNIAAGASDTLTVKVDSASAYLYGATEITFYVTRYAEMSGLFVSEIMGDQWSETIYQMGGGKYRMVDLYEKGKNIDFTIASDNSVTVASQAAWTHSTYGTVYVSGTGTYDAANKKVTFSLQHFVSAGSFGTFNEVLYFE
jgi:hypothetical protein